MGGRAPRPDRTSASSPTISIMSSRSPATTMSGSAATSTASTDEAPPGMNSVSGYPTLFAELIRRGWSDQNLAKLAGGNVLRVMRRAEAVAASMKNEPPRWPAARRGHPCNERATAARGDHPGDAAAAELQPDLVHRDDARRVRRSRRRFAQAQGRRPRRPGVTIEKILLTHGHIDHCGSAGIFAEELGVPIEGPHEDDRFWIDRLVEDGAR